MTRSFKKFTGFIAALMLALTVFECPMAAVPAAAEETAVEEVNNYYGELPDIDPDVYGSYSGDYYDYSYDYYNYSYDYYDYSYDYYDYSYDYYDYSYDYYDYSYDYYDYSYEYYDSYYFDEDGDVCGFYYEYADDGTKYYVDPNGTLRAFYPADMTNIKFPEGIKTLDLCSMETGLYDGIDKLKVPDGVEKVILYGKMTSVSLPNSVTELHVADWIPNLTKLTLPSKLKTLTLDFSRDYCKIKSITVPKSVTTINIGGDGYAISLLNLSKNKNFKVYKHNLYKGTTLIGIDYKQDSIYIKKGTKKIADREYTYAFSEATKIAIPSTVTYIGSYAFSGFENVKSLKLPSKLKTIGEGAFLNMNSLTSITVPSGVKTIPDYCFCFCEGLAKVNLKGKVTSIGAFAFYRTALTSITLPDTVKRIGEAAFEETRLTEIKLPKKLETIGRSAFAFTDIKKATIPASVKDIKGGIFDSCFNLEKISVEKGNKYYVSHDGLLMNKDKTEIVFFPNMLKDVSLPDTLNEIDWIDGFVWYSDYGEYLTFEARGTLTIGRDVTMADWVMFDFTKHFSKIVVYNESPAYYSLLNMIDWYGSPEGFTYEVIK